MRLSIMLILVLWVASAMGQSLSPDMIQHLRWRCIGPHRGGRTVGASGVPGRPNEFYIGVNNGGVWKTTDFGRVWTPIFDDQPTGSIGFLAVAPSAPDTVYVGSGEGLQRPDLSVGDGMYKSVDGGKTWTHLGLRDAQQISCIAVHPRDPNIVYVSVLGHPYGPNETRGLYKTTDGGSTWTKLLGPDEHTGSTQVVLDPKKPDTVYCSLWAARQAPWENGRWQGSQSGLFKSTDAGETWTRLEGGLPTASLGLGRIGIGISATDPDRIYASVDARQHGGFYRSDDGGQTWRQPVVDPRLWGRGDDFAEIKVDPTNADVVYSANVATYKSTDGGETWVCWRGAPGGDDYHTMWINPTDPKTILLASDQGAIVTVNGGQTFSSWYNQPTAQFYHVSTDDEFPYNVYGGQQESGSVGIASRGNDGQITFREWHPVGVEEYGYVAADPLDANIIFGGKVSKFDKRTGQVQNIDPPGEWRALRTAPVLFSPVDKKLLYFAANKLFATRDRGVTWEILSTDLSRESTDVPTSFFSVDPKKPTRRGVIYAVAPSHFKTTTIWCGTDDGLVWLTKDGGKTWKNITPPDLTSWAKVTQIDAGHFDDDTAFVSVNRIRCDDQKPYIYVTRDAGKTWSLAVGGLPDDPVNAVREDPQVSGLVYCATERMVHVSLDYGRTWTPLRLNMPCTSIRDIVVKDDDLVVGTHGRSFWILDNVTSLRQLAKEAASPKARLFTPQVATRVRWNMNTDTPLPPEEPGGQNPPDGAMIEYWLPADARLVELVVKDKSGDAVRRYSSRDKVFKPNPLTIPLPVYWLREPSVLSTEAGAHRWLWDMRRDPITPFSGWVPMQAIAHDTPVGPQGPWAPPGDYTVELSVDGVVLKTSLKLRMDPRVKDAAAVAEQSRLSSECYRRVQDLGRLVGQLTEGLAKVRPDDKKGTNPEKAGLHATLTSLLDTKEGLPKVLEDFLQVINEVDQAEMMPTAKVVQTFKQAIERMAVLKRRAEAVLSNPLLKE